MYPTVVTTRSYNISAFMKRSSRDFPGGAVTKTLSSRARDVGSVPGWAAKIPHALWPKKHKTEAIW